MTKLLTEHENTSSIVVAAFDSCNRCCKYQKRKTIIQAFIFRPLIRKRRIEQLKPSPLQLLPSPLRASRLPCCN